LCYTIFTDVPELGRNLVQQHPIDHNGTNQETLPTQQPIDGTAHHPIRFRLLIVVQVLSSCNRAAIVAVVIWGHATRVMAPTDRKSFWFLELDPLTVPVRESEGTYCITPIELDCMRYMRGATSSEVVVVQHRPPQSHPPSREPFTGSHRRTTNG
jgi:hypothetical protein